MEEKESKLDELIKQNISLNGRLSELYNHIIQMILRLDTKIPMTQMEKFSELLEKPLKVDDRNITSRMKDFQREVNELANLDVIKSLGELKFIGKRLCSVEEKLDKLIDSGTIHNVGLEFKVDGYTLVKKPINHDITEKIEVPYADEEILLKDLEELDKIIVKRYLEICGEKKATLKKMAEEFGVSFHNISNRYHAAVRKMRHNKKEYIKALKNLGKFHALSIAIIGIQS
jgi:hypothetical protein